MQRSCCGLGVGSSVIADVHMETISTHMFDSSYTHCVFFVCLLTLRGGNDQRLQMFQKWLQADGQGLICFSYNVSEVLQSHS